MRAQIDINEVEVRTKIRAKYLRAIENEEWDLLPGEVYVKSFLRTYGDFLGQDTRQLLDDFKRQYEAPSDHELRPIAPLGRDRDRGPRGPRIPAWLAVAVVLIGVVVALYLVGRNPGSRNNTTPSTHAASGTHHPQRGAAPTHRRVSRKPTRVKLQLVPTGQVYVCLIDGRGRRLIPGLIYSPGQTVPVKAAAKLLLTLGNNAVQLKVNGVRVPVSASAGSIGYEFSSGSHRILPAAQQPRCT